MYTSVMGGQQLISTASVPPFSEAVIWMQVISRFFYAVSFKLFSRFFTALCFLFSCGPVRVT